MNTYTPASNDTGHDDRHKVAEVTICQSHEFPSTEADIVQCHVINAERLVRVLHKPVDGCADWRRRWGENQVRLARRLPADPQTPNQRSTEHTPRFVEFKNL